MTFYTYIIFSKTKNKYYTGITNNINNRLKEHNNKKTKTTSVANDWTIVFLDNFDTRKQAYILERKIKSTGAKKYLEINNLPVG